MASLVDLFDGNFIASKSLLNIIKKYMSRDVALSFTAMKPIKDKLVLKVTTFCKCVISKLNIILYYENKKNEKNLM